MQWKMSRYPAGDSDIRELPGWADQTRHKEIYFIFIFCTTSQWSYSGHALVPTPCWLLTLRPQPHCSASSRPTHMPGRYPSSLFRAGMDEVDTVFQQVLALQDEFNVGSHQRVDALGGLCGGQEPIGDLPRCRPRDFSWVCCWMARAWEAGNGVEFECDEI